jgi:hypothetical protein
MTLERRLPLLRRHTGKQKTRLSGDFEERMMGLEPTTFCMAIS